MHRGWMENDMFADEPYTEREAWEWLIEHASYDGKQVYNILGEPVILKVGQLSYAYSYMAKAWNWNKTKVCRFITKIRKWNAIEVENETLQMIITICNYSQYQGDVKKSETDMKRKPQQKRNQYNRKEVKEVNNIPPIVPQGVWDRFLEMRKKKGKPPTDYACELILNKLTTWKQRGHDPTEILQTSIENGWTTVYEPKGKRNETSNGHKTAGDILDETFKELYPDHVDGNHGDFERIT